MSPSKRSIWSKMNVLNRQSGKLTRPKGVAIITGRKLGGRGKKETGGRSVISIHNDPFPTKVLLKYVITSMLLNRYLLPSLLLQGVSVESLISEEPVPSRDDLSADLSTSLSLEVRPEVSEVRKRREDEVKRPRRKTRKRSVSVC